jgi:hypothetical protein
MHLFGFNLPRTHNAYFLASSFSDIWRRINIYWKDFMMQTFFFPAFFRLRPWGDAGAVVGAVLCVFTATWLAHSWQAFWLLDDFPFTANDAALWASVGAVVAASSLWDFRTARRDARSNRPFSIVEAVAVSLQTIGVFACVCLFWARWTNRELFRFLMFGDSRLTFSGRDAGILAASVAVAIVFGVGLQYVGQFRQRPAATDRVPALFWDPQKLTFEQSAAAHLAALIAGVLLSVPQLHAYLGTDAARVLAVLSTDAVGGRDAMRAVEGYYERLNEGNVQAIPFLDHPQSPRNDLGGRYAAMTRPRRDLLETELIPGWQGEFAGAAISVNRWGMRDRDRTLAKSPGTFRIALVGSSPVMGYGVGDDETFARLLEEGLNARPNRQAAQYEVLNFGAGSYFPIHRRVQIERTVLQFRPDLILYFAHQDELFGSVQWVSRAVSRRIDLEDSCLDDVIRRCGITRETPDGVIYARLSQQLIPVLSCIDQRIAQSCRTAATDLVWVYLPMPGVEDARINPRLLAKLAGDAGIKVLDLTDWSTGFAPTETTLSDGDHHPSALGHRLIAERLLKALQGLLD